MSSQIFFTCIFYAYFLCVFFMHIFYVYFLSIFFTCIFYAYFLRVFFKHIFYVYFLCIFFTCIFYEYFYAYFLRVFVTAKKNNIQINRQTNRTEKVNEEAPLSRHRLNAAPGGAGQWSNILADYLRVYIPRYILCYLSTLYTPATQLCGQGLSRLGTLPWR